MRIAVTYADGEIFQHFGHTQQFKVYEVENIQIILIYFGICHVKTTFGEINATS